MADFLHWLPFSWGFYIELLGLLLYYGNERSFLHHSAIEKLFWSWAYGWMAFILVWLPDSPLLQMLAGGLGNVTIVILAAFLGWRVKARNELRRHSSPIQHLDLSEFGKPNLGTFNGRVTVSKLSHALLSPKMSIFDRLLGRTKEAQRAVLAALQDCCQEGAENLCYALSCWETDLPRLFAVAGTQDVLELLLHEVSRMDVVTKAKMVDALQRQTEFFFLRHLQEAVVQLLVSTAGSELTVLKSILDEGGDFYNLHKLVFCDLNSDLRDKVLKHTQQEGSQLKSKFQGTLGGDAKSCLPCKILSDIDDTLYSSGGHFPAGADKRFPKGQVYPGVLALFREIDRACHYKSVSDIAGDNDNDSGDRRRWSFSRFLTGTPRVRAEKKQLWLRVSPTEWTEVSVPETETVEALQSRLTALREDTDPVADDFAHVSFVPPPGRVMSNLVFLSARPHAYKDYTESKTYDLFQRLCDHGSLHCMPTLLAGRLGSSVGAAAKGVVIKFRRHLFTALPTLLLLVLAFFRSLAHPLCLLCLSLSAAFIYGVHVTKSQSLTYIWASVGEAKVETFTDYQNLYSECSTVFFGDNGQGDLWCAEQIGGSAPESNGFVASFIHEVIPREDQLTSLESPLSDDEKESEWKHRRIFFHRTYLGAALNAHECGLISAGGLRRVGKSAVNDLIRMRISFADSDHPWRELVMELNADVERANRLLLPDAQIDEVPKTIAASKITMSKSSSVADLTFDGLCRSASS